MATDTRASYVGKNGIVKGPNASSEDIACSTVRWQFVPAGRHGFLLNNFSFNVLNVRPRKTGDAVFSKFLTVRE